MSDFNPESLLDVSTSAPMATRDALIPEGDYEGVIKTIKGRQTSSEKGTYNWLDFQVEIDGNAMAPNGQTVSSIVNRPSTQVRYSISIDMDGSGLATGDGKNTNLGRLREAVNQNSSGPWSPRQLVGSRARFGVKHRFDKNDPSIVYQEIKTVRALS